MISVSNLYLHIQSNSTDFALVVEYKEMEHSKVEQVTKHIHSLL